jgi:hypothetical protein
VHGVEIVSQGLELVSQGLELETNITMSFPSHRRDQMQVRYIITLGWDRRHSCYQLNRVNYKSVMILNGLFKKRGPIGTSIRF